RYPYNFAFVRAVCALKLKCFLNRLPRLSELINYLSQLQLKVVNRQHIIYYRKIPPLPNPTPLILFSLLYFFSHVHFVIFVNALITFSSSWGVISLSVRFFTGLRLLVISHSPSLSRSASWRPLS